MESGWLACGEVGGNYLEVCRLGDVYLRGLFQVPSTFGPLDNPALPTERRSCIRRDGRGSSAEFPDELKAVQGRCSLGVTAYFRWGWHNYLIPAVG